MGANCLGSRREPGCLRFDLLRDQGDPCKFVCYEVWQSGEAMDAHKEMPYVKAWGAFQYGDQKPVISKTLLKADAVNFQGRGHRAAANGAPLALVLQLEIKEECVKEFVQVMRANAVRSRAENGCLHFDLLKDQGAPHKFISYEVFDSADAMEVHKDMPHVKAWGAFQYGDRKPVVSKALQRATAVNFHVA